MKPLYAILKNLRRLPLLFAAVFILLSCFQGKLRAQIPANIDFGSGNFTNWKCWVGYSQQGTATTGAAFGSPTASAPIGGNAPGPGTVNKSRHFITSGSATDYYGRFPIVCPAGGTYSLRIGNDSVSSRADRVQYYVHVPAATTSYNIQCQYAAVLQDGAHLPAGQSTFQVIAYDSATGAVLPAANNLYIAKWAIPGFSPFVHPVTSVVDSMIAWLPWTASTINLSGMAGKTVVIECTVLDCAYGGHWAYGYFDVTATVDSLMASLLRYNTKGDSVVLQGPPGYKSYRWYNQNFSVAFNGANDTARTKTLLAPTSSQYYNLVITPYASIGVPDTIHTPMLKALNLEVSSALLAAVNVYPNPSSSTLRISFPSPFEGTVSLFNVSGESVYRKRLAKSASHDIPTAGFATGIYTLVLKDNQGASNVRQVSVRQ